MTDWTRPADWGKPGHTNKGLEYELVLDAFDAIFGPWKTDASVATTVTATGGTPNMPAGTVVTAARILGKTVDFQIHMTANGATTFGTAGAALLFSIPGGGTSARAFTGTGFFYDSSANATYYLEWKIDGGATTMVQYRLDAAPSVLLVNNSPVTMATGDQIELNGTIEIA